MDIKIGMIVKSAAGRDCDLFMVVVKIEGDFAFIADGKLRLLENPKKKRIKHLKFTNTAVNTDNLTNKGLRILLRDFNDSENKLLAAET